MEFIQWHIRKDRVQPVTDATLARSASASKPTMGQFVTAGSILVRQCGTKWHAS